MSPTSVSGGPPPGKPLAAAIREALERSRSRARPLRPPATRMIVVLAVALAVALCFEMLLGLRPDVTALGTTLLVVPALARVALAVLLLVLAMREGVPGSGPAAVVRRAALLAVPPALVLLAIWLQEASPATPPAGLREWLEGAASCYPRELLAALPALVLAVWLVGRAYPLRPVFAMVAAATGAALVADAALHVTCPQTAWSHTLGVHGAAVATLSLVAAGIGRLVARSRRDAR